VGNPTRKRAALAAVAVIAAADVLLARARSRPVIALLDEPAHAATTWLVVTALAPEHTRAALIASTLLDADHVPSELGSEVLRGGAARPYGHTGLAIGAAALVSRGAALGIAAHLLRDLAHGPGASLAWPLRTEAQRIPTTLYWGLVATAAARVALRRGAPTPPRRAP
jgi:inner membrane protein